VRAGVRLNGQAWQGGWMADEVASRGVWFYWIHWRSTFWDDMSEDEIAVLKAHARHVKGLYDQSRVLLAGAVSEPPIGFVWVYADGRDEARELMEQDPLYASGIVEITLHEFDSGFIGSSEGYDYTLGEAEQPAE
jgi:uncharacterized protein YciI